MKNELTERQKDILTFIQEFTEVNGYPPTYREIGKHFNIASTFGVKRHIDALSKKGYLIVASKTSRTITVVNDELNKSKEMNDNTIGLPIIGRVAAGYPILAEENIEGKLMLDSGLIGNKESCFGLRVQGDSMINAGIFEGDLVIVSPQSTANNGDIVIALLHDEATLKKYVQKNNKIYLVPENEKYKPIEVDNLEEFSIIGKVIGVFRTYN